jgi:hypothetical protein
MYKAQGGRRHTGDGMNPVPAMAKVSGQAALRAHPLRLGVLTIGLRLCVPSAYIPDHLLYTVAEGAAWACGESALAPLSDS